MGMGNLRESREGSSGGHPFQMEVVKWVDMTGEGGGGGKHGLQSVKGDWVVGGGGVILYLFNKKS